MGNIQKGFKPIEGYLISMERDTVNGWYYLKIGLPKGWVYKGNDIIECEVTQKNDAGQLINIKPKNESITVDELIAFVSLIIQTNNKIVEKEQEFVNKIKRVKEELEAEKEDFYKDLEKLRENTFKIFEIPDKKKPIMSKPTPPPSQLITEGEEPRPMKRGRGRPPGSKNKKNAVKKENVTEKTN